MKTNLCHYMYQIFQVYMPMWDLSATFQVPKEYEYINQAKLENQNGYVQFSQAYN
jgi:hypothetical protein